MSKITLTDIVNLENQTTAVNAINANNARLEAALENTLSRDGTSPNQMSSILDMNSHQIVNLPAPGGLNSPLRLTDLNEFIGGGSIVTTNIPAGGSKNQILRKTTTADYDVSWAYDVGNSYNPKNYGAVGDGITDDFAAITACITAARNNNARRVVVFTEGDYAHSDTLVWAWSNLTVVFEGRVRLVHTGTGIAHSFNGMLTNPASVGCTGVNFGQGTRVLLQGNVNTTNLVLVDNCHFGSLRFNGLDASNAIMLGQDTGLVNACAVEMTFDVQASPTICGTQTVVPWYGVKMDKSAACVYDKLIIEEVGNVIQGSTAVWLTGCIGNVFNAGTLESNLAGGINITSTCSRNVFNGVHNEVNGTQQDWIIGGHNNIFIGCAGAGTASGQYLSGNYNIFEGGKYQTMVIQPGATGNTFRNIEVLTSFTDGGSNTTVLGPDSIFAAQDYATARLGNKSFNTASGNTFFLNSKQLTDVTGTGGIAVAQTSPTLITPVLGTVAAGSILTNATGLPISTGVTGLGTGVGAFLGTPSSSNLATAVTDETGSGALVFAVSPTLTTPNIVGTTAGGNASAGSVGEYMTATASPTALTTGATSNLSGGTITLTAGDWDVTGMIQWDAGATTNVTTMIATISTTSATLGSLPTNRSQQVWGTGQVFGNANSITYTLPTVRINVSGSQQVWLTVNSAFTVSTMTASGFLRARRVR